MVDTPTPDSSTPAPEGEAPAPPNPLAGSPLGEAPAEEAPAEEAPAGESTEAAPDSEEPKEGEEGSDTLTADSYTFTFPEGVTVDETAVNTFKETLAKSQVPPEVGQNLIDMHVAELNRSAEAWATAQTEAWNTTLDEWKASINADPELAGSKKAEVTASIANAFDLYGSPEARQAFDLTGAGWNPSIIKFIHKMASALAEGTSVPAQGPATKRGGTAAETLYPNAEG
jgi:hypothetical protein